MRRIGRHFCLSCFEKRGLVSLLCFRFYCHRTFWVLQRYPGGSLSCAIIKVKRRSIKTLTSFTQVFCGSRGGAFLLLFPEICLLPWVVYFLRLYMFSMKLVFYSVSFLFFVDIWMIEVGLFFRWIAGLLERRDRGVAHYLGKEEGKQFHLRAFILQEDVRYCLVQV